MPESLGARGDSTGNVTYDPFGPITGWTWGNGTASTSRTFDTDGKLTALSNTPTAIGNRTFGYDDAFRITSTTDSATNGPVWTLGYDLLDRLNSATKPSTTIGYTYDANGNRLTQTGTSASTYTVAGSSNRLSSTSGALARSYTYDAIGNVLTSGATIHTYNNRGRMKTGRLSSTGTNTSYVYNALGQRMRKSGGSPGIVYFMYDEAGHLIGEYNTDGGTLVQETVWLGDIPIATIRSISGVKTVFYVHTDQLNTPRKVTSTSNQLRWKWDPTPFGEGAPTEPAGAFKYNLRFPGQYFDAESNLNYNYFRDYDPTVGRYAESDPIGLSAGINTYGYVRGNPLGAVDTFGLVGATTVDSWCTQYPIACAEIMAGAKGGGKAVAAAAAAATVCCTEYTMVYEMPTNAQGRPRHGRTRVMERGRVVARAPTNGQTTLNISIPVDGIQERRVGLDPLTSELVIFPRHGLDPINCVKYFHGWVAEHESDLEGRDEILRLIRDRKIPTPW